MSVERAVFAFSPGYVGPLVAVATRDKLEVCPIGTQGWPVRADASCSSQLETLTNSKEVMAFDIFSSILEAEPPTCPIFLPS